MSKDPTKELTDSEKLSWLMSKMIDMEARLSGVETGLKAIEAQGEDGAKTTRPLLNQLIKEMTDTRDTLSARLVAVEKELRSINYQLDTIASQWIKTQSAIREHAERLAELERRPN